MKKKKLIGMVLAMALVLSVGVVAYAAAGGFTMTYLPGTSDTVTNMPDADSGVGGQPYTVSDKIPQREGYEFLGWTLDYGLKTYTLDYVVIGENPAGYVPEAVTKIPAGSDVTLADPLKLPEDGPHDWYKIETFPSSGTSGEYTVKYLEWNTGGVLAEPKTVTGLQISSRVTEYPISIYGYINKAEAVEWTVSGNDEIIFYYEALPKEAYKVNYLEVGTDRVLAPQKVVTDQTIGITVTESAIDIDGYTVEGADTQDLTIKQSKTGKWTFIGWCSDEACTTPITEVTNITADTDVYGKWAYEVIDLANNEITFYYEKQTVQKVSYIVRYIDIETGELICPDVVREDVEPGTFVTEYAKEIEGYTPLWDDVPFEVVGDEVITFLYYEWIN